MIHQPSFSRCWIDPQRLTAPSTSIDAAKKVATTSHAATGLAKASRPKITVAMPPTRNTHHVRLQSALASPPKPDNKPPVPAMLPLPARRGPYHAANPFADCRLLPIIRPDAETR